MTNNAIHIDWQPHPCDAAEPVGTGVNMMPLSLAAVGENNIIKKIGGKPEVRKHLENLGFVVGGNVQVVSALGGNVIVNVKEARVAISEEMALKIMV